MSCILGNIQEEIKPPFIIVWYKQNDKDIFRFSNDIFKSGRREISISFTKNKGCLGSTNLNPNIYFLIELNKQKKEQGDSYSLQLNMDYGLTNCKQRKEMGN